MAEYIEREKLIDDILHVLLVVPNEDFLLPPEKDIVKMIKSEPASDVRPVVRGRWIFDRGDLATCSNCGSETLKRDVRNHKFCHYCGADMRKKAKHDRDL